MGATATVPQAAEAATTGRGGVTPHPRPSPGRFGPFRLQQLVLLQLAAAALLVAWVVEPLLLVPAGAVALALVLLALVRRHQRSLPEWIGGVLALRARRRRAAAATVPRAPSRGWHRWSRPIRRCGRRRSAAGTGGRSGWSATGRS